MLHSVCWVKKTLIAHDLTMHPQCPDRIHCRNSSGLSHCAFHVRQLELVSAESMINHSTYSMLEHNAQSIDATPTKRRSKPYVKSLRSTDEISDAIGSENKRNKSGTWWIQWRHVLVHPCFPARRYINTVRPLSQYRRYRYVLQKYGYTPKYFHVSYTSVVGG